MVRAFYFPDVPAATWLSKVAPGVGAAEVQIAGRPFVDWALDAADRFGVDSAVLVCTHGYHTLASHYTGERDGRCSISKVCIPKGYPQSLSELTALPWFAGCTTNSDSTIVLWGNVLPFYGAHCVCYEPVPDADLDATPAGVYQFVAGRWLRPANGAFGANDAASMLELSTRLLAGEGSYTLPGYSAEPGVHICRNVVIEHGTEIRKPVLLLDNAWCARNVYLENSVIGSGAFVGEGARIVRSVLLDNTFVGEGIELEGKIVFGHRVIDAATGSWTDIEEPGMIHGSVSTPRWIRSIARWIAGSSVGRRA